MLGATKVGISVGQRSKIHQLHLLFTRIGKVFLSVRTNGFPFSLSYLFKVEILFVRITVIKIFAIISLLVWLVIEWFLFSTPTILKRLLGVLGGITLGAVFTLWMVLAKGHAMIGEGKLMAGFARVGDTIPWPLDLLGQVAEKVDHSRFYGSENYRVLY